MNSVGGEKSMTRYDALRLVEETEARLLAARDTVFEGTDPYRWLTESIHQVRNIGVMLMEEEAQPKKDPPTPDMEQKLWALIDSFYDWYGRDHPIEPPRRHNQRLREN